ncbi:ATP-grasp domain-containing protein [Dactylosporangium siamense]|uniref:Carboxylase n=1 Tax=Dactylosporangium siamense TaxID=685454 RepID=A0A919PV76_9ACTN|nr:ATP-grasp domain-containing protein [Dactylosporangium siamense]GIG50812.1 carboxylase [Dactylosporangium siamense]
MRPVILVGFVGAALPTLPNIQPDQSVIFVEEPDVVRKRDVRTKVAGCPTVRELVEWEFHLPGKADEFYHTYRDLDPEAVIPLTEYATPFAARLAERYGLPGAGFAAASLLRDKALLRNVSRAAGVTNPRSVRVDGPHEVLAFMRSVGGPIVLKPANRQASVGAWLIHDPAEVPEAWDACVVQDEGVFVPDRPMELRMLAEECVLGEQFSVEMLVRAGEDLFTNVTRARLVPGPIPAEESHVVPADTTPELMALLREQTRRIVDAVGFRDGIVHCEWIVSDGVPNLVECAGRFAGDGIIELIERAYPVDLVRAYYAVMKGVPIPVVLPRAARRAAAVRFLTIGTGVVRDVRGVDRAAEADGVFLCDVTVQAGERFGGLRSSWDRVGDVMVTGDTPQEALRLADRAAALIEIDVLVPELETVAP